MSTDESITPVKSMWMTEPEDKSKSDVTVTTLETPQQRPTLQGRRRTTTSFGSIEKTSHPGDDGALTKIGRLVHKIHEFSFVTRYTLYVLPVAGLLAIPLALLDTKFSNARFGNIRMLGLFIWIEIIWVAIWVCKLISKALPVLFQASCGMISTGIRKYSLVLLALEIPISLFLWSITAWATVPVICSFDRHHCGDEWLVTFRTVMVATIAVAAVFLAEKFFVQMVSINYHHKQFHSKIRESKRTIHILDLMYDASRRLFPPFCPDFIEEDYMIQDPDTSGIKKRLDHAGIHTRVFNDLGRARDKFTAVLGSIAHEISGKQVLNPTSSHSIVISALETKRASKALARRLWLSFVSEGKDALYKEDMIEILGSESVVEAEEIFAALDKDCNGDVSLDEMIMLVIEVGVERKNRARSMHDISQAIAVLDRLLSMAVLIGVAFIYAAFFSKTLATKTAQVWSAFTGLAFAIGGTVTEFLGGCIFLFVKHPYDVGDRVDVDKQELVVERISLMYSVFRRVDSDKSVQIPHSVCNSVWIENISRSKAMKERITLAISAGTSSADILALRNELEAFVNAPENKRDFQPDFDIELLSVGDLKQLDLRVEIRHKSNFSNEVLRSTRRNRFMCALLAACRRVPIEPPGGSGNALGGPANPSYSVAVSDADAQAARAQAAAEKEAKRLFPSGNGLPLLGPKGAEEPALEMMADVNGRRGSTVSEVGLAGPVTGLRAASMDVGRRISRDSVRRQNSMIDIERGRGGGMTRRYGTVEYLGP